MIAANGVTARFLEAKGLPSLRRVLRAPERWDADRRAGRRARATGCHAEPDARALEDVSRPAARRRIRRGFRISRSSVVKLLGRGEYVVERPGKRADGHFGLAVRDYSHSTAPNRRFPDLITQRLLKAALAGRPAPYGGDELDGLARHCTEQEDNADQGRAAGAEVGRRAPAGLAHRRAVRRDRDRRVVEGHVGAHRCSPPSKASSCADRRGSTSATACACSSSHTDVERGFIDFGR